MCITKALFLLFIIIIVVVVVVVVIIIIIIFIIDIIISYIFLIFCNFFAITVPFEDKRTTQRIPHAKPTRWHFALNLRKITM